MWFLVQQVLGDWLSKFKVDETFLWSKQANDYIKVGATFQTYEFGNLEINY